MTPSIGDLMIDPQQGASTARDRLDSLAEFDGLYPEDIPEPVRNAWRGRLGLQAILLYAAHYGNAGGEPVEQYVRDLLSDLMHLCDLFEDDADADVPTDFDSLLERARFIHDDEVARP